jgi:hypothetical protein
VTRKHTPRRHVRPLPPRGLRPCLTRDQILDLGLVHIVNLDRIASGDADEDVLWDIAAAALTWSRVAILLDRGVPEMAEQLGLATRLVQRFGRTGRVLFTGTDYQLAKRGVDVMDQLAQVVDRPTAIAAANWSERKVAQMRAECSGVAA